MINGRNIEVSLQPVLAKDLDTVERGAPVQVDMRNVRYTDVGNVKKRRGYAEKWDTTAEHPIKALIPIGEGYAIDGNGTLYQLGTALTDLTLLSTIDSLPRWVEYAGSMYLVYGSTAMKVTGQIVDMIPAMPRGKYIALISSYTIVAGQHETEFAWSAAGNPENWTVADGSGVANIQKTGTIKNMIDFRDRLMFFKEEEIEVWNFKGAVTTSDSPFARYPGGKIDVGLGAVNSVVKANDKFYWLGHDGDFYEYNGAAVVISGSMRSRLDEMNNSSDLIGFDIRKENVIMWVSPTDGMTFLYDYAKNKWLEDSRWEGSGWQSMPFLSYMELNRKQYFGSRNCDGKIHEWSDDYLDDNGQPIRVFRRFKFPLTASGRSAKVNKMKLRRKAPVATSAVASPIADFRWRFDNGDWSNSEHMSLGETGSFEPTVDIHRLGIGAEMEFEIAEMDAVDFLVTDMILIVQELSK
jgi:hypothetical protein